LEGEGLISRDVVGVGVTTGFDTLVSVGFEEAIIASRLFK